MTLVFGKKVLKGEKKLYKLTEIKPVHHVPQYPILKSERVWKTILSKPHDEKVELLKYFPDYTKN